MDLQDFRSNKKTDTIRFVIGEGDEYWDQVGWGLFCRWNWKIERMQFDWFLIFFLGLIRNYMEIRKVYYRGRHRAQVHRLGEPWAGTGMGTGIDRIPVSFIFTGQFK